MSFRSDREVLGSDREVFVTLSSKEMLKQMLVSNCATCNVFVKVSSIFTGDFVVTLYHRFPR